MLVSRRYFVLPTNLCARLLGQELNTPGSDNCGFVTYGFGSGVNLISLGNCYQSGATILYKHIFRISTKQSWCSSQAFKVVCN